jgi:hypothetical protein
MFITIKGAVGQKMLHASLFVLSRLCCFLPKASFSYHLKSSLLLKVTKANTKCHPIIPKPNTVTMSIKTRALTPNGGDIDAFM